MADTSTFFVLRDDRSVKDYMENCSSEELPSTDAVRPSECPACGVAARPPAGGLNLHGHGTRPRTVLGPLCFQDVVEGRSRQSTILVRRYRCQNPECRTTMTVVPREVRPYGLYVTLAVVAAFALWVFHPDDLPIETVRAWVSPMGTDYPGWLQLRRWADDAHRLPEISSGQPRAPPEQFARSVVQQIAASSPDGRELPLWKRAIWQAAPSNHAR